MATKRYEGPKPVAFLHFCSTRPERMTIFPRKKFNIGRDHVKQLLGTESFAISNHHLHFRCVVYEDDDEEHRIAPMIYFRVLSFNSVELRRTDTGHNTGVTISRGHEDILLSEGDELQLTPEIYLRFQYHASVQQHNALDDYQRAEARHFEREFTLSGRRLGVGGQASVFIAVKRRTQQQFACKALLLPDTDNDLHDDVDRELRRTTALREARLQNDRRVLAREYTILGELNHPNVVSLEKVICATYNIYIFQELITGGDLLSYMDQYGPLAEPQAAAITFQLLKAVEYLHSNGYVHRDIKPENILMTSWREGARIALTDFGQARTIDGAHTVQNSTKVLRMQSIVGTYGYTAPEIFQQMKQTLKDKGYSKAVDIWSIGCVTSALLSGDTLFPQDASDHRNPDTESLSRKRYDAAIIDEHSSWTNVSRKAKSFVKRCLIRDEGERATAEQALSEEWFTNRHYAPELAAAYKRAIEDWQPRKHGGSLIEFIETADAIPVKSATDARDTAAVANKSKHFQALQKPVALPPPAMKKMVPQLCHQPPMSRDAKEASKVGQSISQQDMDSLTYTCSVKPDAPTAFSNYTTSSAGPLSILQYGPPPTQATLQPQQRLQQYDSATQSQSMLGEPARTSLALPASLANNAHGELGVLDSRETQSLATFERNERPRKKVCR